MKDVDVDSSFEATKEESRKPKMQKKNVFQFVHYVQIFMKNIIIILHLERDVELELVCC